jgi:hypothetical protein
MAVIPPLFLCMAFLALSHFFFFLGTDLFGYLWIAYIFLFLLVLGFELRASHLRGRGSTTFFHS